MALVTGISPEIRAEAAAWLARLRADDKSAADEAAFRAWLATDRRHATAFELVTDIWETAGAARKKPVTGPATHRRALLAGIGSLVAGGAILAVWQKASAETYETGVGEQKHTVLPDGTQVFLDTNTKIRTHFDNNTRAVALERGRCNFHLRESDKRPFVVDAAADRVVATRCTFDMCRDGDDVCVVMTQGVAEISARDGAPKRILRAGDRYLGGTWNSRTDRPNLVPLLAWQTGLAVFDNVTLAEAIREMNRYSLVKVAVDENDVGKLRISGVYRVGDNVAFAHSIASLLPVILEVERDKVRLEPDPARARKT
jgi:transmembrane sensor